MVLQVNSGLGRFEKIECTLTKEVEKLAKKELREDETIKEQTLAQFRDWIRKNHDLQNIRIDANFLLRFLRTKKYSLPAAQVMLLKYLNLRQTFKHLMFDLDYLDPPVMELINKGYLFPSPIRDKHGRRVIIGISEYLDAHKYSRIDMSKVHAITYEVLMEDEQNQIVGFTHFGDFKHVSAAHLTIWSPTEFATVFRWGEQSVPMRHKEIHFLNVPSPLKYAYDFVKSLMSSKIRERLMVHNNLAELHANLDPKVLPKEYGGDIPMAEMIEMWKKELAEKRERLLALDHMKLLDNSCLSKKGKNGNNRSIDTTSVIGSFRKLEVD
ncbi:unnamed protein product [Nezara viridula]|uniref:CRAL-TRIO domain-containing protein n=1 Tax=Nezara viridula TaxID=85310 RepID=A0A9P0E3V6_NEZVI|nr:unnamed protein product [Nezara viridula]